MFEQTPDKRKVAQQRHFLSVDAGGLFVDSTEYGGLTVVHQYLCDHFFGVDGWDALENLAYRILLDLQVHNHAAVRRDLRCYGKT